MKPYLLVLLLLTLPIANAQTLLPDAGILPSNPLWRLDVLFDDLLGDPQSVALERLSEIEQEIRANHPSEADKARQDLTKRRIKVSHDKSSEIDTETERLDKEYNTKFDFNTEEIKDRVNAYLEANNLALNEDIMIRQIGFKRSAYLIKVTDAKISSIEIMAAVSGDKVITLSHGEIWAALHSQEAFDSLVRKATTQTASQNLKTAITKRPQ